MSVFSNSLVVLLTLAASPVWAQNAPVQTAPALPTPVRALPPLTALGNDINNDINTNAPSALSPVPTPTISVAPLSKPTTDGFGTISSATGGLSSAIWKNTTRESADSLLQLIRTGVANDTLKLLVTQLLTTQAAPPTGAGTDDWFKLRVQALMALGQDTEARQMIASLPASMVSDALLQSNAELMLASGQTDTACLYVGPNDNTHATVKDNTAAFWRKLSVLCQARTGKHDEALLGIELMRESAQLDDPFFQEAIRKMGDKAVVIKSFPKQWTLFDVALIRSAGDTDKLKDRLDQLPPISLKYLAQDATLEIKFREKATGKAQAMGVIAGRDTARTPDQAFARPVASDVTTLVTALGSGKPATSGDNAIIARLAVGDGVSIQDARRITKLLALMEPFGYHVPTDIWQKLFAVKSRFDGETPAAMLLGRLNEASTADRKADVILLSALIAGPSDTERMSDLALLPVVKALRATGFEKEARAVAFSAVKSYK